MKKIMAPILISALMLTNVPVMAANFSDINNVPWDGAKTYINDVADKGIMVGSVENGKRNISIVNIEKIAIAFKISLKDFFDF